MRAHGGGGRRRESGGRNAPRRVRGARARAETRPAHTAHAPPPSRARHSLAANAHITPQVRTAGGLLVLGTSLQENGRIEQQLRGRAGRQGDPGTTQMMFDVTDPALRQLGDSGREWRRGFCASGIWGPGAALAAPAAARCLLGSYRLCLRGVEGFVGCYTPVAQAPGRRR